MKANYFLGNGQFEVREEAVPEIGADDVLVKVAACGICGTDVHIYHGDKGSAAVHSFPVEQLKEAILMQMSDESIKVIVEP